MKGRKEEGKKPTPFVVTWDMIIYVPLYALLLLAIFAGISALMIWGLEQVACVPETMSGSTPISPRTEQGHA